jgi:hypothetical protein
MMFEMAVRNVVKRKKAQGGGRGAGDYDPSPLLSFHEARTLLESFALILATS